MASGLPAFKGLVDDVYSELGDVRNAAEAAAYKDGRFDKVLGLLEDRTVKHRVREIVIDRLSRPSPSALTIHKALLELSRVDDGYRLVTTNFDNRFSEAGLGEEYIDSAPKLPVPKPDVWNSLVHLHGRVSDRDPHGRHLVLSTPDFGTAYLTEGWASRFITELAREFTILFLGYSVGDPVVAYMIDALAAERARGRHFKRAFAFASFQSRKGDKDKQKASWEAKGVVPLLYKDSGGARSHQRLSDSVIRWAGLFRGGLASRTQLAIDRAKSIPTSANDDSARLVVWALFEPGGTVARDFANLDPSPPIEWLDVFEEAQIEDPGSEGAILSLLQLPSPLRRDPIGKSIPFFAPLVDRGVWTNQPLPLHPATRAIGYWIARQLDNPKTLEWVLAKGGMLHPEFKIMIREALSK
jgi:hypothetical protein